tara:strand:- start:1223 stop:2185 length:963 start_codon:yes stop_codon:yes gene_type:complete
MAKYNLPKKTKLKTVLICILYHDNTIDLLSLINKIKLNIGSEILIIVDGKIFIKQKKKIIKENKKVNFFYSSSKNKTVPFNRNIGLKFAKNRHDLILYLDSDVIPEKNLIYSHLKYHKLYEEIPVIGGGVIPSFFKNRFNVWEMLDGCLSWFTSIKTNSNKIIKKPYHLPTCNLSIKIGFIYKHKIKFDEKLKTGEDVDFCNHIRNNGGNLLLIKDANVYHEDRKKFLLFMKHHISWGKHQYYTLYQKKFSFPYFKIIFFLFYPFFMPFINLLSTFFTILPWVRYKYVFALLFVPTYIIHLIKGLFTYLEFFNFTKKKVS